MEVGFLQDGSVSSYYKKRRAVVCGARASGARPDIHPARRRGFTTKTSRDVARRCRVAVFWIVTAAGNARSIGLHTASSRRSL